MSSGLCRMFFFFRDFIVSFFRELMMICRFLGLFLRLLIFCFVKFQNFKKLKKQNGMKFLFFVHLLIALNIFCLFQELNILVTLNYRMVYGYYMGWILWKENLKLQILLAQNWVNLNIPIEYIYYLVIIQNHWPTIILVKKVHFLWIIC
jgi:hypothetical protein